MYFLAKAKPDKRELLYTQIHSLKETEIYDARFYLQIR